MREDTRDESDLLTGSRTGMHDEPSRLIENQNFVVFVEDIQAEVYGFKLEQTVVPRG
jgi:hypothetical protein